MMNPTIISKQDLFFENLLVLGFNVLSMSKEYRISFDKKMFCLPNQKAFEVVSYFLFTKLNEVSAKKYLILWPLLEVKAHREFQKACFSHLTAIAQESEIRFPTISQSVLSSFGVPFYELFFAFSTHVVLKTNGSYGIPILKRPKANHSHHKHYIRVLQISTISFVKKFIEVTEISKHHLETYGKCAKNLMTFIDKLKIANTSFQALLEDKNKRIVSLNSEEKSISKQISLKDSTIKNEEYQKQIEKYWTLLENFLSKEEKLWNFLSTELEDDKEKPILEGNKFSLSIQNSLNKSHCCDHKHKLWTENKGLNLYEFLKMFSCILELYRNSISKGNFSQTHLFGLLKDMAEYEETFERLKHQRDRLENDNMLMKNNIKQLMADFQFSDDDKNTIYEELPPFPSTCVNARSVNILDLEKCINPITEESQIEDVSSLSSNGYNSNNECSKVAQQNICLIPFDANLQSDIFSVCPQNSSLPLEFKKKSSSEEIAKESDLTATEKLPDDSVNLKDLDLESNMLNETSDKLENIQPGSSPGFDLPLSWLLEESLNSQTLGDDLSFLE